MSIDFPIGTNFMGGTVKEEPPYGSCCGCIFYGKNDMSQLCMYINCFGNTRKDGKYVNVVRSDE